MNTLKFRVSCVPPKSTHQAGLRVLKNRMGKRFIGRQKKSNSKRAERMLLKLLRPHVPKYAFIGAVSLSVKWIYPYRESEPKKNRTREIPCDTRPDCSNLIKGLEDVMTKLGFWKDDSQVSVLRFRKYWGPMPGIEIEIGNIV